jgi:hypothetical protein
MANRIKTKSSMPKVQSDSPRIRRSSAPAAAHVPAHDRIAREAYAIWEFSGCPAGRALEHWLEAEQRIGGASA